MASLRDIRTRIASVKNTKQITSAMKMVSAAKLRRATEAATLARPYQQALTKMLQRVAASAGDDVEHPLLASRDEVKKVLVVVVTSDRGLCGGFNSTLNRRTEEFVKKLRSQGRDVTVRTFGRKAKDYFRARGFDTSTGRTELTRQMFADEATKLGESLTSGFAAGDFDEAYVAYNQFKSTLTQIPTFQRVLPLSIEGGGEGGGADYIYEPGGQDLLDALLPMYLRTQLLQAFLETEAGEHAARMTAMDNATRNASDLISALTLEYNRGRQAAITKELIEIVSGAEAL